MSSETERFQAIRARWQAATPGPWCYDDSYFIRPAEQSAALAQVSSQPSAVVALTFERWPRWGEETVRAEDHTQTRLNAVAIAAAPTDVATLLAALDAAQAERTILHDALQRLLQRGEIGLYWEDDCACTLCEADRQVARVLGRGRTSDGFRPVSAIASVWAREETTNDNQ